MDPYDEQRLRDEVVYLHSLWHQGPPRSTSTTSSNHLLHQLSSRTQFKREKAKPRALAEIRRNRHRINRNQEEESSNGPVQDSGKEWPINPTSNDVAPTSVWPTVTSQSNSQSLWRSSESGKEWPCNPSSDAQTPTSGWPIVASQQNSQPILISPEQQARYAHFKALKATKKFFKLNNSDDDELRDDNESDEDEDHGDLTEEEYRGEECRFFVGVFENDSELREYYEKNYQDGDFSCLVCCGVGLKNASKKFKDCVALIQHSVSIAKTKKRRAHRAYGMAICKVLGWDIQKLPTIVSALSANLGVSSSNSGASLGETQGYVGAETKENLNVPGNTEAPVNIGDSDELKKKDAAANETFPSNDESIVPENSSTAADTSNCLEDPNLTAPIVVEDKELGHPSDVDTVVRDEGKEVALDDLVKNDAAS